MAALLGVTRASSVEEPRRRRSSHRLLCAFAIITAHAIAGPISAQTPPPVETIEAPRQEPRPPAAPSAASLERIRRALALEDQTTPRGLDRLTIVDDVPLVDRRRAVQLVPGLAIIGGVDLFGAVDVTTGPVPMGGPTHRAMMSVMTPREMTEARAGDVLGIATASAFSLMPYAVKAVGTVAGWLFGDDSDTPEHPILTEGEETLALDAARADGHVLDAGIHQRGRTVALSLVVPADTPPDTARALGERFVVLVKTFASTEPDPNDDVGTGDYDYIVRVSSPTEAVIALGGKATSHTKINW